MRGISLRTREALTGVGFVLPAVSLLLIFGLIPIFMAIYISLFDFPLTNPARREFLGLGNYLRAVDDKTLFRAFTNTIYFAVWNVPIQTGLGLGLAVLIWRKIRAVTLFRIGYYLPVVVSMVVASVMWKIMADSQTGLINSFLTWMGIARQPFFTSATQALPTMAIMLSWKWVGFGMVIFLAGLHAIPSEVHEAAAIDGANPMQSFVYVTLPLLRRPFIYILVTNTIAAFKLFTPVYVITQGGPQNSTMVMIYYIFREAFQYNRLGYASAIAVVFAIFLIGLAAVQLRLLSENAG